MDALSAEFRASEETLSRAETAHQIVLLKGTAAAAAFNSNAWTPLNGSELTATSFDVIERTAMNTIMDGMVAADAPQFLYTPSGSGYVEAPPLGLDPIAYAVVGYVSSTVRVVAVGPDHR